MEKIEIVCKKDEKLFEVITKSFYPLSFSLINKLIRQKDIKVNNIVVKENVKVFKNEKIDIFLTKNELTNTYKNKFEIYFEDENILIVNKFKGIEVNNVETYNIEKVLKEIFKKNAIAVNRIDRNTEGLVIFAKTNMFFDLLKQAMKDGEIGKFYLAQVCGLIKWKLKNQKNYLVKDAEKSLVKIYDKKVANSVLVETRFGVVCRNLKNSTTLLIAKIKNGKTHQIRAVLAHLGNAIVGDKKYGNSKINKQFNAKTQHLFAFKIVFNCKDSRLNYLNKIQFKTFPNWLKV